MNYADISVEKSERRTFLSPRNHWVLLQKSQISVSSRLRLLEEGEKALQLDSKTLSGYHKGVVHSDASRQAGIILHQ